MIDDMEYIEQARWLDSDVGEHMVVKYAYMTNGETIELYGEPGFHEWLQERIKLALSLVQGKSNESLREYVNSIKERR